MDVSVIIPTTNRLTLPACLASLRRHDHNRTVQIVVVDDAPTRRVDRHWLASEAPEAELARADGFGPAAVRNLGLTHAAGDAVFFTDDDVVVDPDWIRAGCAYLDVDSRAAGFEAVVATAPYDYLFEQSLENDRPGAYWTCNIAYRRSVLDAVGGFSREFPWPHGEDRDLGYRVLRLGPIGFEPAMRVTDVPRQVSIKDAVLQGRWVFSSIALVRRHPEQVPSVGRLGEARRELAGGLRHWLPRLRDDRRRLVRSPRLLSRFLVIAVGHLLVASATIAQSQLVERAS